MKININSKRIKLALGSILFILLIFTIQSVLSRKYDKQLTMLSAEIEDNNNRYIILEDDLRLINAGSNETRRIMSLPEKKLSLFDSEKSIETQEIHNDNLAFYNAVDYLLFHSDKIQMEIDFYNLLNSEDIKQYLANRNLIITKAGSSSYNFLRSSHMYFSLTTDNPGSPLIKVSSAVSTSESFLLKEIIDNNSLLFEFIDQELSLLDQHYSEYNLLQKQFKSLMQDIPFNNFLHSENLELSELKTDKVCSYYIIKNKDMTFSMKLILESLRLQFIIGDSKYDNYSKFYNDLRQILKESDKRTEEIRLVDTAKLKVESVLADEVFKAYLKQNNFEVNLKSRQDNDYIYYDITDKKGRHIGSFGVQKIIGDIYLMDSEDIMISSLKYLENYDQTDVIPPMDIPENLPLIVDKYSNNNSTTFVIIGSHENNADTIILVHADDITDKMTLIAVPRDLYYQERKINDYYRSYGGDKFIEILSDITGLSIIAYVAVDMYAFIDLINILGGIDINLESDLIDPTYTVRDNGEWSTLYYKMGAHHLNGIEALRIARSRHTSSDFGRTSRQQLVIQGIKDKMTDLDITDLGTILKLFQTLEKYLDTNLSSIEMLGLFMKYKDTEVKNKQGLSTFNVLYNTYTNIYKLKDKSKQFEEDFYRGYWILLPHKDDWNVIKWFIRSLLEDDQV